MKGNKIMGERAVIVLDGTTNINKQEKLGLYLHWQGTKEDVENILKLAKKKDLRKPIEFPREFWANLCHSACEYIGIHSNINVGIGLVKNLDCHNYDNGVFYINDGLEIVRQTDGTELEEPVKLNDGQFFDHRVSSVK